jgi:hypothetical protein
MSMLRTQLKQLRQQRPQPKPVTQPRPAGTPASRPAARGSAVEADPRYIVTYDCGHKIGTRYLQNTKCPQCRKEQQRRRRVEVGARNRGVEPRERKASRLPDGAEFHVVYDAASLRWIGTLVVENVIVEGEASGVFKLLELLDRKYRDAVSVDAPQMQNAAG